MTKLANHKAKTLRLVLIPKPNQEEKIRAFKEIVARNGLCISDILYEKVEDFLREHNWPPGNSQTLMSVFTEQKLIQQKCHCGEPASYEAWSLQNQRFHLCTKHFEQNKTARLLKKWRKL